MAPIEPAAKKPIQLPDSMKNVLKRLNSFSSRHPCALRAARAILVMLILAAPFPLSALNVTYTKIAPLPTQTSIVKLAIPFFEDGSVYYTAQFDTGSDKLYGLARDTNAPFFLQGDSIDGLEVRSLAINSISGNNIAVAGSSN